MRFLLTANFANIPSIYNPICKQRTLPSPLQLLILFSPENPKTNPKLQNGPRWKIRDGTPTTTTEEESPLLQNPKPRSSVKTKVPEVEVHLYRSGKGPVEVLRSALGGWDQDRLEVQDLLDKHGLKSLHAFSPDSGRGAPVRFNARNGRSLLPYKDGSVIFVDGEPKDSLLQPITKIIVGIAMLTLLIAVLVREEVPVRFNISKLTGDKFPPWLIACIVIVFTRLRKRTKHLLQKQKFGWW